MPLGPPVAGLEEHAEVPPAATMCVVDGRDARRCPECGRAFAMKAAFAGKTIRCRGCKAHFRVTATPQVLAEPGVAAAYQERERAAGSQDPPPSPARFQPPPPPVSAAAAAIPLPTIFEDIGDILDELTPGEKVASVVRPKNAAAQPRSEDSPVVGLIAVVFGALCALPATQLIVWWAFGKDPLRIAKMLPEALRWLAPAQF